MGRRLSPGLNESSPKPPRAMGNACPLVRGRGQDSVNEAVKKITNERMADIVINALGSEVWDAGLQIVGMRGKIVVFGVLTGGDVKIHLFILNM